MYFDYYKILQNLILCECSNTCFLDLYYRALCNLKLVHIRYVIVGIWQQWQPSRRIIAVVNRSLFVCDEIDYSTRNSAARVDNEAQQPFLSSKHFSFWKRKWLRCCRLLGMPIRVISYAKRSSSFFPPNWLLFFFFGELRDKKASPGFSSTKDVVLLHSRFLIQLL